MPRTDPPTAELWRPPAAQAPDQQQVHVQLRQLLANRAPAVAPQWPPQAAEGLDYSQLSACVQQAAPLVDQTQAMYAAPPPPQPLAAGGGSGDVTQLLQQLSSSLGPEGQRALSDRVRSGTLC